MLRSVLRLRWLLVVAAFVGCVYQTDRTQGVGDGEIHGTARRKDGTPAKAALVSVAGSARVVSAGADGSFAVKKLVPGAWVLHVTEDDDGDGVPERATWIETKLAFLPVAKGVTQGCTGTPPSAVTTELLGDVKLDDTQHIKGTVTGVTAGQRARVVVVRTIDGHQSPIEAEAAVKDDGSFDVGGVAPGAVHVAALAYDPLEDATGAKVTTYGIVDATAGDTAVAIDASQKAREDADPSAPKKIAVQLDLQWNTPATPALDLALASFTAPDNDGVTLAAEEQLSAALDQNSKSVVLDVAPAGVVDVSIQSNTDGASDGTLRGALVLPGVDVLGPLEMPVLLDPCDDGAGHRDCDRDGLTGLPLVQLKDDGTIDTTDPNYASWKACAAECADKFGPALIGATCKVGGETFDCDDDADGQPDVTEGPACLGPGLGTDLDGDDLCEPTADPVPNCTGNDPTLDPECGTFHKPSSRYP